MKILFFDYWLKGVSNFNRLMPEIQLQYPTAVVKMIHVGSWKQPQCSIVNEHNGFRSYDIKYYHTWSLFRVLKKEKPDIIITLNLYYLLDKALIVFCKNLGIKTVYLSHGKFSSATNENLAVFLKSDLKANFLSKIRLDTINMLRNYFLATLIDKHPWRLISSILKLIKDPASMTLNSKYSEELAADKILVYYPSDKNILVHNRNFPDTNIIVVGNPELDGFIKGVVKSKEDFIKNSNIPKSQYLLYLDDGFVQARLMSTKEWHDHLCEINSIVKKSNLQMVIKLHPRTSTEEHSEFFKEHGIISFSNEVDFKSLIQYSECVVSIMSTTISYALFLNKRIISPRWGSVARYDYAYPENVVHYSKSIDDFRNYINGNQPTNLDKDYVKKYISDGNGDAISQIVTNFKF